MIYKFTDLRFFNLIQNPIRFSGGTSEAYSKIHIEMQRAKNIQDAFEEESSICQDNTMLCPYWIDTKLWNRFPYLWTLYAR